MNKRVNNNELKIHVWVQGSLLVSLLVLMMMMSLSWACLGREGTCYLSFQHCVFHREAGGARGLWLNFASLPRQPALLPPTLPPFLSAHLPLLCLSHSDSSFGSASTFSPFPLLLTAMSVFSFPVLPLSSSCRSLQMRFEELQEAVLEWNVSAYGHLSAHLLVYVCTKKDQKDESRSAVASKKSISVWPCLDWKRWDY